MRRRTLRGRLNTVLFQWFFVLAFVAGAVLVFSFPGIRRNLVDDRLLLAQTVARALDATVSSAIQEMGRLSSDLPASSTAAPALRAFRFQQPFAEASYLLDAESRIVAADPPETQPLTTPWLGTHEAVTPLVRKAGANGHPVVAMVQPFQRGTSKYYLVSEMNPFASTINAFLSDLAIAPDIHVAVIDDTGTILASADAGQLLRTLPNGAAYGDRIRAHRPLVTEGSPSEFETDGEWPVAALTVMAPLRFAPWGIVVEQRDALAFSGLYSGWWGVAISGMVLACIAALLSRTLSRSVVRPIQQLSRQAEAMRAGDLSSPIAVSGDHEVQVLASTLDDARGRLRSTLEELQSLNENLERQVAARTKTIEAKYRDLTLLHAVSVLCTEERDPDRFVPEILRLVVAHYRFDAAAVMSRQVPYVAPPGADLPWLAAGAAPDGWRTRAVMFRDQTMGHLYHPDAPQLDEQVLEALTHQLAIALASAHFWKRTMQQDDQRQVLVRRLLAATEDERRRLARELHDEIAQLLTVIQLSLHRVDVDTPEMQRAKSLLVKTQEDIHRIIHDLRPSLLDDLGLRAAMESYADDHLVREGISVSLEIDDHLPSRPEIETTIFRIYQELVTNILRHAQAEHVSIELYERDGKLVLAVEDDGCGFDPEAKFDGSGITGMRERAALVNGIIRFDSEPGTGAHIAVEIPLQ
ncbi:MAG: HAMP domain-containing protein [Acidobacteria bacterium]|nr:HAMP domain-containing protein [Acidobacteriota bacterium]